MSGHTVTTHEMPLTGHNVGTSAKDRLRSIVDRIERLADEQKGLGGEIKDLYVESKAAGFDVAALRQLIAFRRKDAAKAEEQLTLFDTYRTALEA
jgi:uncharacterized protein (UPF0335 family)